jgi:nucleotide-binding universal stress UspA family protein
MTARLTIDRILCPTDFSESAARALRLAVGLARWWGARVTVLHVVAPSLSTTAGLPSLAPFDEAALRAQAEEDLATFVAPVLHEPVTVEKKLRLGDPAREIQAVAKGAGLLVMGTHGRSGFEHLMLGSVTETLLRRAPCPVITVSGAPRPTTRRTLFKRVLCAADLGEGSEEVIAFALAMAEESEAEVILLHVIEGLPDAGTTARVGLPVPDSERLQVDLRSFALDRLRETVPDEVRALCPIREEVAEGGPAREILRVATEGQADLIVMGAHSRGPLGRAFFGSTSNQVVRESRCPVLTVRGAPRVRAQAGPEAVTRGAAAAPKVS